MHGWEGNQRMFNVECCSEKNKRESNFGGAMNRSFNILWAQIKRDELEKANSTALGAV